MTDPKEYGKALFSLSLERGNVEEVRSDVECLIKVLEENPDYIRLLDTPALTKTERLSSIDTALSEIETDLRNLVKIFAEMHSVYKLREALKTFLLEYDRERGIFRMEVISAIPLTDSERERLKKKLESETGGTVVLTEITDPSILGGLIVRGMGKQRDDSLASRLRYIEQSIMETVV